MDEVIPVMLEKYEICRGMLHGFDYSPWLDRSVEDAGQFVLNGVDHILGLDNGRDRFSKAVRQLSKVYALAGTHEEAEKIHDEVALFQAIRGSLVKSDPDTEIRQDRVEHAVRQLVSTAIASDEVVDVLTLAGLETRDISILSESFLSEVAGMKQKNLAAEMLQKLIKEEIRGQSSTNVVKSRKFSEMLTNAVRRYQNRSIEAVQVIEELLEIARKMKESKEEEHQLDMTPEEIGFYTALAENDSAVEVLGDETLREMATVLTNIVRRNVTVDWMRKESARANLRVLVKRFLKHYGYPPDKRKMALDTVVEQAENIGDDWVTGEIAFGDGGGLDIGEGIGEEAEYPYEVLDPEEAKPFENCVPLVSLQAAAGAFSEGQTVQEFSGQLMFASDVEWVALPDHLRPQPGFFVAQVVGESMNRRIPNGTYCLFRPNPTGTRNGKVVLAQHRDIHDSELGAGYTVKIYRSQKEELDDGSWRHVEVRLEPDSDDDSFEPIVIRDAQPGEFAVLAELVEVVD